MIDFIARIFASPKSIEKTIDAAIATGDKLVFTQEEKAEHDAKLSEWYLRYLEATQPQALARRLLAMSVGGLWALLIVTGVVLGIMSVEADDIAAQRSMFVFRVLGEIVATPFTVIMGFYFAGHYIREFAGKK